MRFVAQLDYCHLTKSQNNNDNDNASFNEFRQHKAMSFTATICKETI